MPHVLSELQPDAPDLFCMKDTSTSALIVGKHSWQTKFIIGAGLHSSCAGVLGCCSQQQLGSMSLDDRFAANTINAQRWLRSVNSVNASTQRTTGGGSPEGSAAWAAAWLTSTFSRNEEVHGCFYNLQSCCGCPITRALVLRIHVRAHGF